MTKRRASLTKSHQLTSLAADLLPEALVSALNTLRLQPLGLGVHRWALEVPEALRHTVSLLHPSTQELVTNLTILARPPFPPMMGPPGAPPFPPGMGPPPPGMGPPGMGPPPPGMGPPGGFNPGMHHLLLSVCLYADSSICLGPPPFSPTQGAPTGPPGSMPPSGNFPPPGQAPPGGGFSGPPGGFPPSQGPPSGQDGSAVPGVHPDRLRMMGGR